MHHADSPVKVKLIVILVLKIIYRLLDELNVSGMYGTRYLDRQFYFFFFLISKLKVEIIISISSNFKIYNSTQCVLFLCQSSHVWNSSYYIWILNAAWKYFLSVYCFFQNSCCKSKQWKIKIWFDILNDILSQIILLKRTYSLVVDYYIDHSNISLKKKILYDC